MVDKAHRNPPQGIYRQGTITQTWLRDLAKLSRFERGPLIAQEYLSQHGICLVIEPPFKKTYGGGGASGKPPYKPAYKKDGGGYKSKGSPIRAPRPKRDS